MENTLKDNRITATVKQIYGSQKQMIESSKSSGAAADEVCVYEFYESFEFLSDSFTARKT